MEVESSPKTTAQPNTEIQKKKKKPTTKNKNFKLNITKPKIPKTVKHQETPKFSTEQHQIKPQTSKGGSNWRKQREPN